MFRLLLKAKSDGFEFPVYFNTDADVADACEKLGATVVEGSRTERTETDLLLEQFETLVTRKREG